MQASLFCLTYAWDIGAASLARKGTKKQRTCAQILSFAVILIVFGKFCPAIGASQPPMSQQPHSPTSVRVLPMPPPVMLLSGVAIVAGALSQCTSITFLDLGLVCPRALSCGVRGDEATRSQRFSLCWRLHSFVVHCGLCGAGVWAVVLTWDGRATAWAALTCEA